MHATSDTVEVDPSVWIVDSGVSRHISGCRDLFEDSDFLECSETVTFSDERVSKITGKGSVRVRFFGVGTVLKDVYYCADLGDNLFSVSAAVKHGVMISYMEDTCRFRFSDREFHDVPFTTSQLCVLTDSKCRAPVRMRATAIKDAAEHTKEAQPVTKENDCAQGHTTDAQPFTKEKTVQKGTTRCLHRLLPLVSRLYGIDGTVICDSTICIGSCSLNMSSVWILFHQRSNRHSVKCVYRPRLRHSLSILLSHVLMPPWAYCMLT